MNSPHEILGISSNSTMEKIEAAFQEKSEYWRRLQSNPQRSNEATAMLEQVIAAYEALRTQYQSTASGLEFREPRSFSGQAGTAPVDKDRCPHCGHKGNPPDARFCLNLNCRGQLFQLCPSCKAELPWHYQSCPRCGVHIDEEKSRLEAERRRQEIKAAEERQQRLSELRRKRDLLADEWLVFNRTSEQNQVIDEFNREGKRVNRISIVWLVTVMLHPLSLLSSIGSPIIAIGIAVAIIGPDIGAIAFGAFCGLIALIASLYGFFYSIGVRFRIAKRPIALQNCERAIAELKRSM